MASIAAQPPSKPVQPLVLQTKLILIVIGIIIWHLSLMHFPLM